MTAHSFYAVPVEGFGDTYSKQQLEGDKFRLKLKVAEVGGKAGRMRTVEDGEQTENVNLCIV